MNPDSEPKFIMDADENWITVEMVRTRSGKGWIEKPVLSPSDRVIRKEAA